MRHHQLSARESREGQYLFALSLLLVLAFSCPTRSVAQEDYVQAPHVPGFLGSAYLMIGGSQLERRELVISDFRNLAPGSELLGLDLSDFRLTSSWQSLAISTAFSMNVGIHPFRNEVRRGPELRMGLQFASGLVGSMNYERSVRHPLDTLISSTTGAMFIIDSTHTTQLSFRHNADRIGVEGSLIFRTGGRSRWSLYVGGGLGFGTRMNVRTTLTRNESASVNSPGSPRGRGESVTIQEERYANSGSAWGTLQVPWGFGFQMARRGDFLRRVDLFFEQRLSMLMYGSSELGSVTSFGAQSLFGVRVRLD